jgi:hypothetical protein
MNLIELKVKPLEWSQNRYGDWIALGIGCNYHICDINKNGDYYCKVILKDTNKIQESFYDSDISQMKHWCYVDYKNSVIRHFNNSINMHILNSDIKFY